MKQNEKESSEISPEEAKSLSRGISRDMSPEAIQQRLEMCAEISALCIELARAKVIGPVNKDRSARVSRGSTGNS